MIQSSFTTRVLTPEEGHVLTQSADVDIKERIFSDKVFLGKYDVPENWKEITEDEAEVLKAEQEAAMKAEIEG